MIPISLRPLEQTGALEILRYLLEKTEVKLTELLYYLRSIGVGQSAMYRSLKLLKEANLIDETITDYPKLRLIRLTEKGRRVAEYVLKIKEILESPDASS